MTVEYPTATISYRGNGSTKSFPFLFRILREEDIVVSISNMSTAEVKELTLGVDYDVIPTDNEFPTTGGSITYPKNISLPALSDGYRLTITRNLPYTQPDVYAENSTLIPTQIEKSFDRVVMLIQQINDKADTYSISAQQAQASADKAVLEAEKATEQADRAEAEAGRATEQANNSESSANKSELFAQNAQNSSTQAGDYAYQAEQSAQAVAPEAYDSSKTYNFPDVVAYTDGETYRCIGKNVQGENPDTSPNWVRIAGIKNDFWDIDINGGLMPAINPTYSEDFVLDSNGDIMPREME